MNYNKNSFMCCCSLSVTQRHTIRCHKIILKTDGIAICHRAGCNFPFMTKPFLRFSQFSIKLYKSKANENEEVYFHWKQVANLSKK